MIRLNRYCYLALALVLATGIVVMAGHSTRHSQSVVEQCLMCSSHADPKNTTLVHMYYVPAQAGLQSIVSVIPTQAIPAGARLTFLARAPPATS